MIKGSVKLLTEMHQHRLSMLPAEKIFMQTSFCSALKTKLLKVLLFVYKFFMIVA